MSITQVFHRKVTLKMSQCNVGAIVSMHSQRAVVSAVHDSGADIMLEIHPPFIYQSEILHQVPLSGVTVLPITELDEALPLV